VSNLFTGVAPLSYALDFHLERHNLLASNLATTGVILWGCYRIFQSGPTSEIHMTTGALIAASMLTSRAMAPLGQIAGLIIRFHQSWTSLKGLNRLMALPVERPRGKVFIRRPRIEGAIEFRNVQFKYPNAQTAALDGVSFKIQPGERVGILGRIGSGKTTIEKLIAGFYEPQSGTILVDGTDIRQIDPIDLRRNVGYLPQNLVLFAGSVRDNLVWARPDASDAELRRALERAAARFAYDLPGGIDCDLGEGGRQLSGGERQRIALARALLREPRLLILDEATSAIDAPAEREVAAAVGHLKGILTIVIIGHRGLLTELADRQIVLDSGRVVSAG